LTIGHWLLIIASHQLTRPMTEFRLVDLNSQASAVQAMLKGRTTEEKLAWIAERGELVRISISVANAPPTYQFISTVGLMCAFFICGDEFVLIGDHTTYTVKNNDLA